MSSPLKEGSNQKQHITLSQNVLAVIDDDLLLQKAFISQTLEMCICKELDQEIAVEAVTSEPAVFSRRGKNKRGQQILLSSGTLFTVFEGTALFF